LPFSRLETSKPFIRCWFFRCFLRKSRSFWRPRGIESPPERIKWTSPPKGRAFFKNLLLVAQCLRLAPGYHSSQCKARGFLAGL